MTQHNTKITQAQISKLRDGDTVQLRRFTLDSKRPERIFGTIQKNVYGEVKVTPAKVGFTGGSFYLVDAFSYGFDVKVTKAVADRINGSAEKRAAEAALAAAQRQLAEAQAQVSRLS